MSQEIIEAVREIERDKGIEEGALVSALEDALLAAYKKTPGASRHATVEMTDEGDFRVFSIELPADVEERLLDDARERKLEELERLEEETGERQHTLIADDDLDVDWSDIPEDQVRREDVTPEDYDREKEIYRSQAAATGKPAPVVEKIVEGKMAKFYEEVCLLDQPFIKEQTISVSQLIASKIGKLGENISVRRFARFKVGEQNWTIGQTKPASTEETKQ